jgi:tyramine---L-glutamate ligase
MRVFVYEHVTGGGLLLGDGDLTSLVREGDMMIRALLGDLAEIPGVEPIALRDPRLESDLDATLFVPNSVNEFWPTFERALEISDAVWPVAPERDGWLERMTRRVLDSGRTLLNSRTQAVRLATSKLATSRALTAAGVRTVATYARADELPLDAVAFVAKPDDGAGCMDTYVARGRAQWDVEKRARGQVYQPLVEGDSRSLCVLCCDGYARLLCCNRQHIVEENGKLEFAGVTVNALGDGDGTYARLAQGVAAAIPGLWGHVGVDFIETPSGPLVIEVNPRVTTACAALRSALGINLGALVLELPGSLQRPTIPLPGTGRAVHVEVPHPNRVLGKPLRKEP